MESRRRCTRSDLYPWVYTGSHWRFKPQPPEHIPTRGLRKSRHTMFSFNQKVGPGMPFPNSRAIRIASETCSELNKFDRVEFLAHSSDLSGPHHPRAATPAAGGTDPEPLQVQGDAGPAGASAGHDSRWLNPWPSLGSRQRPGSSNSKWDRRAARSWTIRAA